MPIRRIITIVREQYEAFQKRFASADKKEASAAPAAVTAAKEGEADVVADAEEAPTVAPVVA